MLYYNITIISDKKRYLKFLRIRCCFFGKGKWWLIPMVILKVKNAGAFMPLLLVGLVLFSAPSARAQSFITLNVVPYGSDSFWCTAGGTNTLEAYSWSWSVTIRDSTGSVVYSESASPNFYPF